MSEFDPEFVIAIDPGKKTGMVIYNLRTKSIATVTTVNFWQAFEAIASLDPSDVFVVIESSKECKRIWQKPGAKARVMGAVGRSIGGNNAEAELLAEGLRRKGYVVKTVAPSNTKLSAERVRKLTGYTGRTNEHNRDALMIAMAHKHKAIVVASARQLRKGS